MQASIGGTHGYLLSLRGARALLALAERTPAPITIGIDSFIYRSDLRQLTLDPPILFAQYLLPDDPATHDSDCID
jgi:GR25 family glycosyltransferase involved in LPS biosynthesis